MMNTSLINKPSFTATLITLGLGLLSSVGNAQENQKKQEVEQKKQPVAMLEKENSETIKALLVTGEGYHDYEAQKKIITEGTKKLMNVEWTIWHHKQAEVAKKALSEKGWADPFDIVVYNICHAHEKDQKFVEGVVDMHKQGKPAVAIHCTMHSYHWELNGGRNSKEDKEWNKLLGVVSPNHGPQAPITVTKCKGCNHDAVKNMPAEWKTPQGELYNISKTYDTATILAKGNNGRKQQGDQPVIWVNKYGKANVFATTLGHHNETMKTKEFLQTLSDGIIWAVKETKKDQAKAEPKAAKKIVETAEKTTEKGSSCCGGKH